MQPATIGVGQLAETSKRFARQLFTIGKNRLQLLMVELQEGREILLHSILLAVAVAVFGLLAGITLTAALVVLFWDCSHVAVLLTLTGLYGAAGFYAWRRLSALLRNRQPLSGTIDQLEKDRACLEKILE
ncbi:MAG: phage holin family protein [Verrucomicrobiota bacterium]|jgi:uncharacterized membrane protein YqjE